MVCSTFEKIIRFPPLDVVGVPWVPEVFFSLTSGEIGHREHKLQPETAQEKPLAPRVL